MGKFKLIFESLSEAAVRGARHADSKLPQLPRNHSDQIDNWVRRIRDDLDRYDAPSSRRPSNGNPDNGYTPDMGRRPASMTDEEYLRILDSSVHNPDGPEAVLGKFRYGDTQSYIDVADGRQPPAAYFSLGNDWGTIRDANGLTDDGMFDAFNVPFLERMMAEGKAIHFSHNPQDFPESALAAELEFLENHGYEFDAGSMQAIPR